MGRPSLPCARWARALPGAVLRQSSVPSGGSGTCSPPCPIAAEPGVRTPLVPVGRPVRCGVAGVVVGGWSYVAPPGNVGSGTETEGNATPNLPLVPAWVASPPAPVMVRHPSPPTQGRSSQIRHRSPQRQLASGQESPARPRSASKAPGSDLAEPEKVDYQDLQFVEALGSGEFGQVFRGFYRGEEVAIKQLYWEDAVSAQVMSDLAKEIGSFRHLRHRRLVRFIGACLETPHPCLVTEYMPGGSLHNLLHVRKMPLPALHAVNMCLQVADGVMYLHMQTPTIVHRDLKSLNVVLDLGLNIKLCDFGLTETMERTHITKRNNGGSPRYMAPELFDSNAKITEKIDIWALGCIFVEVFGGPLPYQHVQNLGELTKELLVHRRPPCVPDVVPTDVKSLVNSCVHFDYRRRPSSKAAFEQLKVAKQRMRDAGKFN